MTGLTLDAGALIAYERSDDGVRRTLQRAIGDGRAITIPVNALAQTWRSHRQVWIARLTAEVTLEPVDAELARRAGELMGRTKTTDVVDATVAVSAARRGDLVLTSDPDDLQRLADDLGSIRIVRV